MYIWTPIEIGVWTAVGMHLPRWSWASLALLAVFCAVIAMRIIRRPFPFKFACLQELNHWICRLWHRLRVRGQCTVPPNGPALIVANHTCPVDPLVIAEACPARKVSFMIAKEYANPPLVGWIVRAADCIPVRRDGQDIAATKQAIRHLRSGKVLAIFIEGKIIPPGNKADPKDGAALLALRSQVPVIPCYISGTKYRDSLVRGFFARHKAVLRFGPPIDLSDLAQERGRDAVACATQRIYAQICALAPDGD